MQYRHGRRLRYCHAAFPGAAGDSEGVGGKIIDKPRGFVYRSGELSGALDGRRERVSFTSFVMGGFCKGLSCENNHGISLIAIFDIHERNGSLRSPGKHT